MSYVVSVGWKLPPSPAWFWARRRIVSLSSSTDSSARRAQPWLARSRPTRAARIFAGHLSQEPGHRALLDHMQLQPLVQLDMRLGEGTGAVLTFPLIEAAVRIYNEMATFASAGVSEANEA